jgi:predicted transcriptional regulator
LGLSRLELCIATLKVLAVQGSAELTQIVRRMDFSLSESEEHLIFLRKMGLIRQRATDGKVVYSITTKGIRVLVYFKELNEKLPIARKCRNAH